MGLEALIGFVGIVAAVVIYILNNKRLERRERQRRDRELASKAAEQYVWMTRTNRNTGVPALATLGLDHLGSDALIREAIREMRIQSGVDPWGKGAQHVADLDLVEFFRFVREQDVDFFRTTVDEVVRSFRDRARRTRES